MNFNLRAWACGLAAGLLLAALAAAVPTALDWFGNPGGVFRDADGTAWTVVADTFLSWLGPVFLLLAPFTVLVFARLAGRNACGPCGGRCE